MDLFYSQIVNIFATHQTRLAGNKRKKHKQNQKKSVRVSEVFRAARKISHNFCGIFQFCSDCGMQEGNTSM